MLEWSQLKYWLATKLFKSTENPAQNFQLLCMCWDAQKFLFKKMYKKLFGCECRNIWRSFDGEECKAQTELIKKCPMPQFMVMLFCDSIVENIGH